MTLAVGWVDPGTVRGEFTESVTQLVAYETWHQRLGSVIRTHSGPLLVEGRNLLVEKFLKTDCDWLLMVDTDMTFPYTAAEQLLDTADAESAPVVGGLCYGISKELGPFPTVYQRRDGMPVAILQLPDDLPVIPVDATGAAFTLTHRVIFDTYRRDEYHPWFHRRFVPSNGDHRGGWLGEDISWHWWLRDKGVPILVDTRVEVGHIKPTTLNSETVAYAAH